VFRDVKVGELDESGLEDYEGHEEVSILVEVYGIAVLRDASG
jgi:hypothetical protein